MPRRLVALVLILTARHLRAQCVDTSKVQPATVIGTTTDDRLRIAQDLGKCSTSGYLIRSSERTTARRLTWFGPELFTTHNSSIANSLNDGPQWAGRGWTTTLSGGVQFDDGSFAFRAAPDLVYTQNRPFFVFPSINPARSAFASPWHGGIESADLPLRFGDQPIKSIYPGDSWVEGRAGYVAFGASTDEQWWGPGIRDALVMSNNAPGVPQLYLRTARPIPTPLGDVEFRWMIGALTESAFFDTISTNNTRSLSGVAVTLRTAIDTGLTVGLARTVYARASGVGGVLGGAANVFVRWDQSPDTIGAGPTHASDQLMSLFARWVLPQDGFEVYAEWAKLFAPGLHELLVDPQAHQGYTVGLQWVNDLGRDRAFRIQSEVSDLEQTPPASRVMTPLFYTSRLVPQGYTNYGQILGAAIGPGASAQYIGMDYVTPRWSAGAFVGRTRFEDEVLYNIANGNPGRHDVEIYSGLRGELRAYGIDASSELTVGRRLNYLFQSDAVVGGQGRSVSSVDVQNVTWVVRVNSWNGARH